MQLGRHDTSTLDQGKPLPNEWTEEFVKVLTEAYAAQSEKDNRFFDVYGQIYDKEIVVIVSYIHHGDQSLSPITVFLSNDAVAEGDSKEMSKVLKEMVDLSGHIFDDVFAQEDWSEYVPTWTENKFRDHTIYYKITRENISLSLQAEELLRKDGMI